MPTPLTSRPPEKTNSHLWERIVGDMRNFKREGERGTAYESTKMARAQILQGEVKLKNEPIVL
jgi:hypothetical protein